MKNNFLSYGIIINSIDIKNILLCIKEKKLTSGPIKKNLKSTKSILKVKNVLVCSSGTATSSNNALINLKKNDVVIVTA